MEGAHAQRCTAKSAGRMYAPLRVLCAIALSITVISAASAQDTQTSHLHDVETKKVELFDGVSVIIPRENNTERLMSFEIDTYKSEEEGRGKGKGKGKKKKKLLEKVLPLFIMPFLIQSAIIPLFLGMLKFMLFKSMMVGKFALLLIMINAFKNHNSFKGRESEMADVHYGYHGNGMEEYGAYIN